MRVKREIELSRPELYWYIGKNEITNLHGQYVPLQNGFHLKWGLDATVLDGTNVTDHIIFSDNTIWVEQI